MRVLLSLLVLVQLNSLLISRTAGHYSRLTITCPRCPFERWVTPEEPNRD